MYDRQVRRRRAVLGLLVGLSLILLTAYFGESAGGPFHAVQRGVLQVLAPVQEGADRALKPFRDLFGWAGDTFDAKDERDRLEKEVAALRRQVAQARADAATNAQLAKLVRLDQQRGLQAYEPVAARVIGRSPTVWFSTITVDKGTSSGVRRGQPVVSADGLVGKVTEVTSNAAKITLITDHTSAVSAKVSSANPRAAVHGLVQTVVGKPEDLRLEFIPPGSRVDEGQQVVTAGLRGERLESLFPPNIPIGEVKKVDREELELNQRVHIRLYADLRRLDIVQVLTRPRAGALAAERAALP